MWDHSIEFIWFAHLPLSLSTNTIMEQGNDPTNMEDNEDNKEKAQNLQRVKSVWLTL